MLFVLYTLAVVWGMSAVAVVAMCAWASRGDRSVLRSDESPARLGPAVPPSA